MLKKNAKIPDGKYINLLPNNDKEDFKEMLARLIKSGKSKTKKDIKKFLDGMTEQLLGEALDEMTADGHIKQAYGQETYELTESGEKEFL